MKQGGRPTAAEAMKSCKKLWLIITTAAAAAIDALVSVVLLLSGADGAYLLPPLLLLAADIVYLLFVLCSNMRFSYTRKHIVLYAVARAAVTLWAVVTIAVQDEKRIFVLSSLLIWVAVNFAALAVAVFAYLYAAKRIGGPRVLQTVFAAIFTVALAAAAAGYGAVVLQKGYFGQGDLSVRPLLYRETDNGYVVSEVAKGRGTHIVVPDKFNGKKVVSIAADIFSADGVKSVALECDPSVSVVGVVRYAADRRISAPRETVDAFKQKFYAMGYNAAAQGVSLPADGYTSDLFALGNAITPSGLSKNETYLTFSYDLSAYIQADKTVIPTYIGKKGETVTLGALSDTPYLQHADSKNADDLAWCYEHNDKRILHSIAQDGASLETSASVEVSFDPVYRVFPGESNDTKYDASSQFPYSRANGQTLDFAYTVAATADNILSPFVRNGFTLSWQYEEDDIRHDFSSLGDVLASRSEKADDIYLCPQWQMIAPSVTLTSEGGNTIVYGESMRLSAKATAAANDFTLSYAWSIGQTPLAANGNEFTYAAMPWNGNGAYGVTVTSYSEHSSLTAATQQSVSMSVQKRPLFVVWTDPSVTVYDGNTHTVSARLDNAVTGDDVALDTAYFSVQNAQTYSYNVKLTGDTAARYSVSGTAHAFTVLPKPVDILWGETTFAYSGDPQAPTAQYTQVNSEYAYPSVSGAQTNAGQNYTAAVTLTDTNYTISSGKTHTFTILPAVLTVVWGEQNTFVYDGNPHVPTVTATGVKGEKVTATVSGAQTNANRDGQSYTATLHSGNANYTTSETMSFTVTRKPVSVEWSNTELTYNGSMQFPSAHYTAVNGQSVSLTVTGGQTNAGQNYTATASLTDNNYTIQSGATHTFAVSPRPVVVHWSNTSLTYNGQPQAPTAYYSAVNGQSVSLAVTGERTNAGENYTATASLTDNNYTISSGATQTFAIAKKTVYVSITPVSATIIQGEDTPAFTATATGLVHDDDMAFTVTVQNAQNDENGKLVAGMYDVTVTFAQNDNYDVTVIKAQLVVREKEDENV